MGDEALHVLLIEDSATDAALLQGLLRHGMSAPVAFEWTDHLSYGLEQLGRGNNIDLVLLDLTLPDSQGLDTFLRLHAHTDDVPIVIVSGLDDEDLAIEAVHQGAQDYILKGHFDAESLARSVRFALERNKRAAVERLLQAAVTQLQLTHELQQRLFPTTPPDMDRLDVAGAAYPAEKGCGDYYDWFAMPDDGLGVVVGDVSGHGLGPALVMAETRAHLQALASRLTEIEPIMNFVNRFLLSDHADFYYATLFLARFDLRNLTLSYAGAGHRGYLVDSRGRVRMLDSTGVPLGLLDDQAITAVTSVPLEPGHLLFIPTDGIWESMSPEGTLFGFERTLEVVRANRHQRAEDVIHAVYEAARDFTGGRPQSDDMAAVVAKVK